MGKLDIQRTINNNLRDHFRIGRHIIAGPGRSSVIAFNIGSTYEHELGKFNTAWELLKQGHTIITEGILKNNKRPDICVLDINDPMVYEIIKSENEKSICKKETETYQGLRIKRVYV